MKRSPFLDQLIWNKYHRFPASKAPPASMAPVTTAELRTPRAPIEFLKTDQSSKSLSRIMVPSALSKHLQKLTMRASEVSPQNCHQKLTHKWWAKKSSSISSPNRTAPSSRARECHMPLPRIRWWPQRKKRISEREKESIQKMTELALPPLKRQRKTQQKNNPSPRVYSAPLLLNFFEG